MVLPWLQHHLPSKWLLIQSIHLQTLPGFSGCPGVVSGMLRAAADCSGLFRTAAAVYHKNKSQEYWCCFNRFNVVLKCLVLVWMCSGSGSGGQAAAICDPEPS